ncbi:MAG TPA: Lrp/AsnC family transcriptional regulator [Trueperaceae bacterium]|nr:Lrp/AsnC family transcriptional regulator [Trueperaceae bacterium]
MQFDEVDKRIIDILSKDGRASHASIAKAVGLSAPAVGERVRKLEVAGVVSGYRAVVEPAAVGLQIAAFIMITPQPRQPAQLLVDRLQELPEIEALFAVAGKESFMAKVRTVSTDALDQLLDRVFMLEGVEGTETIMVLRTAFERSLYLPFVEG